MVGSTTLHVSDIHTGEEVRRFPVPADASVAPLAGGWIAVAGAIRGKRIHLYDQYGASQREFGDLSDFSVNARQNEFLNSGHIASYRDRVVFVFSRALESFIEVWSTSGELVSRFRATSDTLDRQGRAAAQVLAVVGDGIGGQTLITALAVDKSSGNIWVAANGGSNEVAIQEYSQTGGLIGEYQLARTGSGQPIGIIEAIAVEGKVLTILTSGSIIQYQRTDAR